MKLSTALFTASTFLSLAAAAPTASTTSTSATSSPTAFEPPVKPDPKIAFYINSDDSTLDGQGIFNSLQDKWFEYIVPNGNNTADIYYNTKGSFFYTWRGSTPMYFSINGDTVEFRDDAIPVKASVENGAITVNDESSQFAFCPDSSVQKYHLTYTPQTVPDSCIPCTLERGSYPSPCGN